MKKKRQFTSIHLKGKFKRVKKIYVLIILLLCGLTTYAESQLQVKRITLNLQNSNMEEFVRQIKEQVGYTFFYNDRALAEIEPISIQKENATIEEILREVLISKGFNFVIEDNTVIIRKAPQQQSQQRFQQKILRGVVVDGRGDPLPGVTVFIKGTSIGTTSDKEGRFSLRLPAQGEVKILFSFIGMESQEIEYTDQQDLRVVMKDAYAEVDDVVVTGYFDRSKASFTGVVTTVKREELRQYGNVNIFNMLSMIDPSLHINENNEAGSDPNTLPDFVIRGEGSFMEGSNVPTFIVDGYEVTLRYIFDMDLERIESISILKDASATIHYGSRAANGVVVIETRRPEAGKLLVNYSTRLTLNVPDLSAYDLMNAEEKLRFEWEAGVWTDDREGETQVRRDIGLKQIYEQILQDVRRGVNTDWMAQPLRDAFSQNHSIYVSGGDKVVTYGLSANFNRNNGVMKKSGRETYGVGFDITYRIRNKVTIRNSFSMNNTRSDNSPYGSFTLYTSANPYNPIYDENGDIIAAYERWDASHRYSNRQTNPLYNAQLKHRDYSTETQFTDNFSLDWMILSGLRLKASASFSKSNSKNEKFKSPEHTDYGSTTDYTRRGDIVSGKGTSWNYNINSTLAYSLNLKGHNIYAGVGLNVSENSSNSDTYYLRGFLDERFNDINFATSYYTKAKSSESHNRLVGFLGTLNYSYENRYFIDLSGRLDGSSKYGKNNRFSNLWSVGVGWNIHNENFLKDRISWLDEFKIRGSIGQTGSNSFDSYMAQTMLQFNSEETYLNALGATFKNFGNPNLEWQKSLQSNIGFDFNVINRRLSLRFDYYHNLTNGLLLPITVAPSLGFKQYYENFGEILNIGVEANLSGVIIRSKSVDWAVTVNAAHNKSKINKISNALRMQNEELEQTSSYTKPITTYEEGESMTAIKVVPSLGINPETGMELYRNRFGIITESWDSRDKVSMGDSRPTLIGTIGTNFVWREWTLNLSMKYGFGGQQYNSTLVERVEGLDPTKNGDRRAFAERWKEPGDITFFKNVADRTRSNVSSRFLQDNNYLEMSNISLSYRFSRELLKRWGITSLRLGLNMADVFYFASIKRERGLNYPFARQFTFSANINF